MIVEFNVDLSQYSNWKIGGIANCMITVNSGKDFCQAIKHCVDMNIKPVIIGNTTNLLFSNGFLDIGLIKLGECFNKIEIRENTITIGGAVFCPNLSRRLQREGISNLQHIIGIPATIGGLVYMNGGSQRKTISESVLSITSINKSGEIVTREKDECDFSYRKSIFQSINELILSVDISIERSDPKLIRSECLEILRDRRNKFPRKEPSCGSVFISKPSMYKNYGPPGKIIEDLGLKGTYKGGAMISEKHANFIVNRGEAKATDVIFLVDLINRKIIDKYGISLVSEGLLVSGDGELTPLSDVKID